MPRMQMPTLPRVIYRPRLEKIMEIALDKRFTLVSGSPGQGKTTLVIDVLDRLPYDVFWYSLDPNNANTSKFIRKLLIFLKELASIPVTEAKFLCSSSIEETSTALADFLYDIPFKDGLFIVLDDFHKVEESSDFDIFVQLLMSKVPSDLHFIIISRNELQWELAQKKVQREMMEIDNSQLTFTPEETINFFKDIYDMNLTAGQLSRILSLTEGWVAAMVLMGDKLSSEWDNSEIISMDTVGVLNKMPELTSYMEQEIYNNLSSEQQNALLATSIVDQLPYDLASHLSGESGAIVLDDLISKNMLVFSTSRAHKTYRYHTFWKAFLVLKATDTWGEERMWELHKQAGAYFFEQENWKEAFYHYVEGQDVENAIIVLKSSGPEILDFDLADQLQLLVGTIPLEKMKEDPWFQFAFACSVRFRDPALCHYYLQRALEGFRTNADSKGQLQVLCLNTEVLMFFPGDLHHMQHLLAENSTRSNPEKLSDLRIGAYKNIYAAMSHCYLTGQLNEAIRLGEEARRISFALQDTTLKHWSCWALALASSFIGNFNVAQKRLAEALQAIDQADDIMSVFIPYMAGVNADFMGEFEAAHSFLKDAHKKSQKLKMEALDFYINNYASYAALYRGDIQLSEKLLNEMGDIIAMCLVGENDHLQSYFWSWKGYHAFVRNQNHEAVALGRQALRFRDRAGGEIYFVHCHLVLGAALTEIGNFKESEYHLLEALRRSTAMGSTFFQSSCYVELAILYDIVGNEELFAEYIEKAFKLAMEKSYYHFFMWRDDRIARIISLTKDQDEFRSYTKELCSRRYNKVDQIEPDDGVTIEMNRMKPVKLFMLGSLIIDNQGTTHKNVGLKKAIYLLTLLAIKSAPISMEIIIEEMWPERDIKLAKNNFHYTLNRLRNFLGNNELIKVKDGLCSINVDKCWTDIQHFNGLNKMASDLCNSNKKQEAVDLLNEAIQIYRGELLEGDNLGALLSIEREALSKQYHHSLVTLGRLLLELGRYDEAVNVLTQACSASFADENSHRLQMLIHYALGNQWQALQIYNTLYQYLASEFESRPHRITNELRDLITDGKNHSVSDIMKWLFQENRNEH